MRRVLLLRGRGGRCPGLRGSPFCEQRQGEAGLDPARRAKPGTRAHILESGPLGSGLVPAWAGDAGFALVPRLVALSRGEAQPGTLRAHPSRRNQVHWRLAVLPPSWVELRLWEVLGQIKAKDILARLGFSYCSEGQRLGST